MFRFSVKASAFFAFCALALGVFTSKASAGTYFVAIGGNDLNAGTNALPKLTVQAAITAAVDGDTVMVGAGTFTGGFNLSKRLKIMGFGSGPSGTIISSSAGGSGGVIQLSVSGTVSDHILFKDIRVLPTGMAGFSIGLFTSSTGTNLSYIDCDNVVVMGNGGDGNTEQERGFYVDVTSSLHYANFTGCSFNNLHYGVYLHKHQAVFTVNTSNVDHINFISCEFKNNANKGFYAEKLSDAMFDDCLVDANGLTAVTFLANAGGIDINLKNGVYDSIYIGHSTFSNNATAGSQHGFGLAIKARDDGSYAGFPASLDKVTVEYNIFSGNERGNVIGERGANNAGPSNVRNNNNNYINNVRMYVPNDGSAYGNLVNHSLAMVDGKNNWWNSTNMATINAGVYGWVDISPNLIHSVGRMWYDIAFSPVKPRTIDDSVGLAVWVMKSSDTLTNAQFNLTVPSNFPQGQLQGKAYLVSGAVNDSVNITFNPIAWPTNKIVYRVVVSSKNGRPTQFVHAKVAGDTSSYAALKIMMKQGLFSNGDNMDIKVSNFTMSDVNGAPVWETVKNTKVMRDRTISHKYMAGGDVNGNGITDIYDLVLIMNHIKGIITLVGPQFSEADLNRDMFVNVLDFAIELRIINGYPISGLMGPGGKSSDLVPQSLIGNNSFKVTDVRALFFSSIEPMTDVKGLEFADQISYNETKTEMSAVFPKLANCDVSFGNNYTISGTKIGLATVSGVDEEEKAMSTAYPNPSDGVVNISNPYGEEATIAIYSLNGVKIYEEKITGEKFTYKNNVAGSYNYTIKSGKGSTSGQFIVK